MKTPFPYFGGKSQVAHFVWEALGQPSHYIEPFFGSGAVLLNRPNYEPTKHTETVNDKDGFLCNAWRALQFNPDEVARWCDWPVNHADLSARKKELIKNENYLIENLIANPEFYDAKLAGYWIWAASCWIGAGLTRTGSIPHISDSGMGVHSIGKIPHISDSGMGVHSIGKIPHISDSGTGVHSIGKIPLISKNARVNQIGMRQENTGNELSVQEPYNINIYKWFRELSERLRYVRVVCGDWTRVCGGNWQNKIGDVGIFFDPPYGVEDRDTAIYHHDSTDIAKEVEEWCLTRGRIESYRIVVAGYDGEYKRLIDDGWVVKEWKATGGYSSISHNVTQGKANRHRERLFFSPHCHKTELF